MPALTPAQEAIEQKVLLQGFASLNDAEVLALVLGGGGLTAENLDTAQQLLVGEEQSLMALSRRTAAEMAAAHTPQLPKRKAIALAAVFELGRRRYETTPPERVRITGSQTVYELMRPVLLDSYTEEFWVLLLDRGNRVIRREKVSEGGVSATLADPKIIFKLALNHLASAIILVHNHPSGQCEPSKADVDLTSRLRHAGTHLDISVLDHIIFAESYQRYYSFSDAGLL